MIHSAWLALTLIAASTCLAAAPANYEILALGGTNTVGIRPAAGVVLGPDGNYYGTTTAGGAFGGGTLFRMTPAGDVTTVLSFSRARGNPRAALIVGSDGKLYGTTSGWAEVDAGSFSTIFRASLDGVLETLATFPNQNPAVAPNKLLQASDGNFYGTTAQGGAQQQGSVFRLSKDGTLTTLVSFSGLNGSRPLAGLVEREDGVFYGTTEIGGANNVGTLFRVTSAGTLSVLHSFGPGALFPVGELLRAPNGNLYGVTTLGGPESNGIAFVVAPDDAVSSLATLPTNSNVARSPLVFGDDGNLYGTTSDAFYRITPAGEMTVIIDATAAFEGRGLQGPLLKVGPNEFFGTAVGGGTINVNEFGMIHRLSASGTATTLFVFPAALGRGFNSELTQGPDAQLYGTVGDDLRSAPSPRPGVFKVTTSGTASPLRRLSSIRSSYYSGRLIQDAAGDLIGTIATGGTSASAGGFIYRARLTGSVSHVFQFTGNGGTSPNTNGDTPRGGLARGPSSELYGTTQYGGAQARGTFFKLDAAGALTTLASFNNATGLGPLGDLIFSDGLFYGMTSFGGANNRGTFFSVTPSGQITALLSFPSDHYVMDSTRLILAKDGNFYGASTNGVAGDLGKIFRLTKTGQLSDFALMNSTTGGLPLGVIQASDDNFYGITRGRLGETGAIFRITPSGRLDSLFRFSEASGTSPRTNLMQAADRALYGTTTAGGPSGGGVVYRLGLPQIGIKHLEKMPNGGIRIRGMGMPLEMHSVRATGDLSRPMTTIATVPADAEGEITFDDPDAANHERRFYRIVLP